ncbi:SDR family oxidoreductase [Achromobacter xylosoxidans]
MDNTPEVRHADLRGKNVVITGGAKGIGYATAEAFVRQGARGAAGHGPGSAGRGRGRAAPGRRRSAGRAELGHRRRRGRARLRPGRTAWGGIDVLVNNAGISANKPSLDVTPEEWRRAVDINLTGVFLCAQAAGRRMVPKGEGCIINLASMYGVVAAPDRAAYCATKGAVVLLTETLAVEWARRACA